VVQQWYTLATGGLFVLDQLLEWIAPWAKRWLDSKWPAARRRPIEIAALVILFGVAGFDAYHDEYSGRMKAEAAKAKAEANLAAALGDNKVLRERLDHPPVPLSPHQLLAGPSKSTPRAEAPLKRLISYDLPTISVNSTPDGKHALFQGVAFYVTNTSSDTITAHVHFTDISIDGNVVLTDSAPPKSFILAQGKTELAQLNRQSPGILLDQSTKNLHVGFEVIYDSIPASGRRISYKLVDYPINFANGLDRLPLVNSSQVLEETEN
jgi:hypothetical protein